jgi:hypothetical protein
MMVPAKSAMVRTCAITGPHKGTTLAQVAMSHPEYVRQLMTRAHRPACAAFAAEVRELERCNQVSVDTRNAQSASGQRIRARSDSSQETTWDLLDRCARVFVGFSREAFARTSSRYGVQRGAGWLRR